MRGYDVVELRRRLLGLLDGSGGMTGSEIARELGISRVTMSRHLDSFASAGVLRRRRAGNATLWSAPDASARFEFPADYARAASEYGAAILGLDPDRAAAIVAACVAHGAAPAPMAGEVFVPAIEAAGRAYADGKAGRAEAALMRGAISFSMAAMRGGGDPEPTRHAVLMADGADGALRAEAAAAAMRMEGWRAMPIGDISASIDALLDTDLERLLVRARAPRGGITAAFALSETAGGLGTMGRIVRSACRGAARGTLLCLCGPDGHGVDADASVRGPADVVHWAASL
ncbi:MAG: winged helix-turn-helix domain-containing protein [Thaumarchaeota archaeon]|nr:winged helix-turn-helix domain-containing protein [Nitrososphaerota archaeon]